jgi:hypothetical protein
MVSQPPTPTGRASAGDAETINLRPKGCYRKQRCRASNTPAASIAPYAPTPAARGTNNAMMRRLQSLPATAAISQRTTASNDASIGGGLPLGQRHQHRAPERPTSRYPDRSSKLAAPTLHSRHLEPQRVRPLRAKIPCPTWRSAAADRVLALAPSQKRATLTANFGRRRQTKAVRTITILDGLFSVASCDF